MELETFLHVYELNSLRSSNSDGKPVELYTWLSFWFSCIILKVQSMVRFDLMQVPSITTVEYNYTRTPRAIFSVMQIFYSQRERKDNYFDEYHKRYLEKYSRSFIQQVCENPAIGKLTCILLKLKPFAQNVEVNLVLESPTFSFFPSTSKNEISLLR